MDDETPDTFSNRCQSFWRNHWQGVATIFIPLAFLPILFFNLQSKIYRIVYLYCVMATYWFTKVVPIYVTALLPAMLLPIMGVLGSNEVCMLYFNDVVVLFFGTMLMGLAIENSKLNKRIAYTMLTKIGNSPRRILWSLIFLTMLLSMWLSNTATTALMCAVVRAVVDDLDSQGVIKAYEEPEKNADENPKASQISSCFFLSVAYAASIGGTGTLLGTATNMAVKGIYDIRFEKSKDYINFNMLIAYTWPMIIALTIFLCIWMQLLFLRNVNTKNDGKKLSEDDKSAVRMNYNELGPLSVHEIQVIILFVILITLFVTMRLQFTVGWADFLNDKIIKNSWPVICIVILLFTLPMEYTFCRYIGAKGPYTDKEVQSVLVWKYAAKNMPWGYIFLLGGGLALAQGIFKSGTSTWLVQKFSSFTHMPKWSLQLICIIWNVFLTSFAWNLPVANLTMPIIAELAVGAGIHPLYLMLPSGLAASYGFLTPISTPPNELVKSYANIRIKYMLLAGLGPTIFAVLLVFANGNVWHRFIYPDNDEFPIWAVGP